jgi:hypothetical protein
VTDPAVTQYWIPVAAGTRLPFQRWSLAVYEALAALAGRRQRCTLLHAALKLRLAGETLTLELTPVPRRPGVAPLMTGAVGAGFAGRLRTFRYQLVALRAESLPDEQWAVSRVDLEAGERTARSILEFAPRAPAHTWGRRVPGTTEMWTSNSVTSWLLTRAGIDVSVLAVPAGGRAPGWRAGIELGLEDVR